MSFINMKYWCNNCSRAHTDAVSIEPSKFHWCQDCITASAEKEIDAAIESGQTHYYRLRVVALSQFSRQSEEFKQKNQDILNNILKQKDSEHRNSYIFDNLEELHQKMKAVAQEEKMKLKMAQQEHTRQAKQAEKMEQRAEKEKAKLELKNAKQAEKKVKSELKSEVPPPQYAAPTPRTKAVPSASVLESITLKENLRQAKLENQKLKFQELVLENAAKKAALEKREHELREQGVVIDVV